MDPCLLCLEISTDILDGIKASSSQWQELDVLKIIEKHFWPMSTVNPSSWICLPCWREVDGFHKFFVRIEEVQVNLGKIKVEDCPLSLENEEELEIIKNNIKNIAKDNTAFCFLEPEILIQSQQQDLAEPEILLDQPIPHDLIISKESGANTSLDELDIDDIPLNQACKRMKLQNDLLVGDPLEKSRKSKRKNNCKTKDVTNLKLVDNHKGVAKINKEVVDLNDNDSGSAANSPSSANDIRRKLDKGKSKTEESKQNKSYNKNRVSRKENDEFIAEHFKQMSCDLCKLPFDDFPALQKHFTKIHKQRCYVVCCKRKFSDRTRLVDHLLCHLNPDHFKCKECGKSVSDRLSFDNHMLRVHRPNEVVRKHSCDVCGKSFTKSYVLRIHKLTHLSEKEKKFPCGDCGKNYASSYQLKLHSQAVHLKRFAKICYICGKAINSSAEFQIHMNKHEGVPLHVFSCDTCGLRLTSERGLKLHKESQHPVGGKREHHCPICPKISPSLIALKKHINTMHEKGYDHKCTICGKAFKRSEVLKEHMATHTGITLYTCPWCPKTFNSNGNMHAHRKKVHPKEWEESKLQKYSGNIPPKGS